MKQFVWNGENKPTARRREWKRVDTKVAWLELERALLNDVKPVEVEKEVENQGALVEVMHLVDSSSSKRRA